MRPLLVLSCKIVLSRMSDETLDRDTLRALRCLTEKSGAPESSVPLAELARAARLLESKHVTIDFPAARELGHPLIVLRVPGAAPPPAAWVSALTPREREVAKLVASGLSNKVIAAELGLSLLTVKDHVHHILTKSGLRARSALAANYPR